MNACDPLDRLPDQPPESDPIPAQDNGAPVSPFAEAGPMLQEEAPVEECPEEERSQEDTPPSGLGLEEVLESITQVASQVERLTGLFQDRILYTEHEETVINQMHRELQRYKEDLYAQLVRPILLDIIKVRDSIQRIGALYQERPEGHQDIPNKTFSGYAGDLQDILEKNNVEIYRSQPGGPFVPLRQTVIQKIPTADPGLNGVVESSLSCGYNYGERILSPEKVCVYCYEKPPAEEEAAVEKEKGEVSDYG